MSYLDPQAPTDVLDRFRLFRRRFEEIKASRMFSAGRIDNHFRITFDRIAGFGTECHFPPDEEIHYVASLIRPMTLKDLSLPRTCTLARKLATSPALERWFALAEMEYRATRENPRIACGFAMIGLDGKLLAPHGIFELFMYATVQHVELSKVREFDSYAPELQAVRRSSFIAVCVELVIGPIQLVSDTLGIALGDLPAVSAALDGPGEKRWQGANDVLREAEWMKRATATELGFLILTFVPTLSQTPGPSMRASLIERKCESGDDTTSSGGST